MQPSTPQEQMIWEGSPSQWLNFKSYLGSAILAALFLVALAIVGTSTAPELRDVRNPAMIAIALMLLIPLFVVTRTYLLTRFTRYALTSERIRVTRGVFSRRTDNLELYRVDDMVVSEPFFLRMVSRGNLVLITADRSNPQLLVEAVPGVTQLRDQLRLAVEKCRDRKKTRVLDFE